jgi:hypothetical protein
MSSLINYLSNRRKLWYDCYYRQRPHLLLEDTGIDISYLGYIRRKGSIRQSAESETVTLR